jgi:protein-disulfide isomerase-like protein with CxxC motif
MTDVEFFFDPSCPWTWVTSRWLATVAPERGLAVTWRPWSLVIKNEGKELPADLPEVWRARIQAGRDFAVPALRALEAAGAEGADGADARGRLFTELGRRFHGEGAGEVDSGGGRDPRGLVAEAVAAAGLAASVAQAGDDEHWDDAIRDTMDEVRREVGDDVGSPILAVRHEGQLRAMSGPIMAEVPPQDRALALWDAVVTVTTEPTIFELKRHRTDSPHPPLLNADGGRA